MSDILYIILACAVIILPSVIGFLVVVGIQKHGKTTNNTTNTSSINEQTKK